MGRKSLRDEAMMTEVINMSWMTIRGVLHHPEVPQQRKEEIAEKIVLKSIPRDLKLSAGSGEGISLMLEKVISKAESK